MEINVAFFKSPIGVLKIYSSESLLHKIEVVKERNDFECSTFNYKVIEQLEAYFEGRLHTFNLPVSFGGATEFQKKVYDELLKVRFGKTKTYKELAQAIGNPGAYRAVGTALSKNPVPIIVPCHRIVNSNGKIGGFALGSDSKKFLLDFERYKV